MAVNSYPVLNYVMYSEPGFFYLESSGSMSKNRVSKSNITWSKVDHIPLFFFLDCRYVDFNISFRTMIVLLLCVI